MTSWRAVADILVKLLAEILHIDWPVSRDLPDQQFPIQVCDPALSLISLATEIIDLRLQIGDFGVPHPWAHCGGDGVGERGQ
jgi:hypothetical protein